jgi:hypothetical protein
MAGKLKAEWVEPILNALPVEISFVDASSTLRYFSKENKRIFPRPPAAVGLKVRACHPKKSIAKVEEILDGFAAGTLDHAMFWIDYRGKKVLIQYFPVRDAKGKYLGCLEATQDITGLQKLRGEKRLLG